MMEMKAAVTWGIGEPFQIEDVELAAPLGCGIQTGAGAALNRLLKFYPFEEINRAFKESHEGKCIKAVLTME